MEARRNRPPRRPEDQPIYTNPVNMDFEKRRIASSKSIYITSLIGGDDLVNANDLATVVNAIIDEMRQLRVEMAQVKLHLASISKENITRKDGEQEVEDKSAVVV